uniref:Uncharacterized protein n=1 Tax=Amphimedon queenslandica TaxID=400682 RepID=A0A1X7UUD5_AMPQE
MYIEESERGEGDGKTTTACLCNCNSDASLQFMEAETVSYCENVKHCRREVLFKDFDYCSKDKPVGY